MDEKQTIIAKLQSIAKDLGAAAVARHEFLRRSGVTERKVQRLFGSYNDLVLAAGLSPRAFPSSDSPAYSDRDILNEVVRVIRLPNSKLTRVFFDQHANISTSACERRFGGWINTIKAAGELLRSDDEAALLHRIREYTMPGPQPRKPSVLSAGIAGSDVDDEPLQRELDQHTMVPTSVTNLYGDFINFRGLQHAPVNEQGVVFLFGMICRELGYVVEIVKPGFPDCEAKRRVQEANLGCGKGFASSLSINHAIFASTATIRTNATSSSAGRTIGRSARLKCLNCGLHCATYYQMKNQRANRHSRRR